MQQNFPLNKSRAVFEGTSGLNFTILDLWKDSRHFWIFRNIFFRTLKDILSHRTRNNLQVNHNNRSSGQIFFLLNFVVTTDCHFFRCTHLLHYKFHYKDSSDSKVFIVINNLMDKMSMFLLRNSHLKIDKLIREKSKISFQ